METRTAEEIQEAMDRLLEDLQAVVQDGEELLRTGARELGEQGQAARERLGAALEVARETRRKLEERAAAGLRSANVLVREHPYQSVGVAFGVGLLLGLLVSRR